MPLLLLPAFLTELSHLTKSTAQGLACIIALPIDWPKLRDFSRAISELLKFDQVLARVPAKRLPKFRHVVGKWILIGT